MKAIFRILITTVFVLAFVSSQAQSKAKKITVAIFADTTIPKDDDGKVLTQKDVDTKGIVLKIASGLKIKTVSLTKKDGKLSKLTKKKSEAGHDIYSFQGAFVKDGKIMVQLCDGSDPEVCKTLLLNVVAPVAPSKADESDCYTALFRTEDCDLYKKENDFGFEKDIFGDDDIIYIYDFNKDESKRRFYKKIGNSVAKRVNMSKESLCHTKQVYFKIVGVNQFIYDVTIDQDLISFHSEPSLLFNRMFLGDSTSLTPLIDMDNIVAHGVETFDPILEKIRCFYKMYADLKGEISKAYDPCVCFAECNPSVFPELIKMRNEIHTAITVLELDYTGTKKDLERLKKEENDCVQYKKIEKEVSTLDAKPSKTTAENTELTEKKDKLAKLPACIKNDERAENIKEMENEIAILTELATIKTNLPKEDELKAAAIFIANMVKQNQSYWKGPITLDGNRLDFSIDIKKKTHVVNTFNSPAYEMHLDYDIPILWKPFVSFSSGSFIALGKNMLDKTYAWQQNPATNNYTLVERGNTELPMGFAALGNVEWKMSRNFGFGPSFGVGLTIEKDPRLVYLAGVSVFLGDLRQFALTFGWAAMNVNHLTSDFQSLVQNQTIYTTTPPSIEYDKKLRVGNFISLSYTPFNPKSKKEKVAEAAEKKAAEKKAETAKPGTNESKDQAK